MTLYTWVPVGLSVQLRWVVIGLLSCMGWLGVRATVSAYERLPALASKNDRIAIFVGAPTRNGFLESDSDVAESIKHLQGYFRGSKEFRLVDRPEDAAVVMHVLRRYIAGHAGAVGVPIGNAAVFLSMPRRVLECTLRVKDYERTLTAVDEDTDTWKGAAKRAFKETRAWVEVNRALIAN